MTPGRRGWIVLACVVVAFLVGTFAGISAERAKWERWTYAHVAFETKGGQAVTQLEPGMRVRCKLELGMRVRCVNASYHTSIVAGNEYRVYSINDKRLRVWLHGHAAAYYAHRFKPIVRVKMGRAVA